MPTSGQGGFLRITDAVRVLEGAGFGFGEAGSKPGQMNDYAARTPTPPEVNTLTIR